jgi:peroxiredoxin
LTLSRKAIAFAVVLTSCAGAESSGPGTSSAADVQHGSAEAGGTASDFSARDIDGRTHRLADHLGKRAILLNFWATWCEPCVAEFPHLRRLYETNKDHGLVVFGVSMDGPETVANVGAFVRRNRLTFPILLDEDSQIAALYNPKKSAPLSVLIDKRGRISAIREGFNPGDEELLARDIAKMLDDAGPAK